MILSKYKSLTNGQKRLVEIAFLVAGIATMYFFAKSNMLRVVAVDHKNRTVEYVWKGERYTWKYNTQIDDTEISEGDDVDFIITQKIQDPPAVVIRYVKTAKINNTERYNTMAEQTVIFT